jgi:hypothetical protein
MKGAPGFELISNAISYQGFEAFRKIACSVPLMWSLLPVLYLPGLASISKNVFVAVTSRRRTAAAPAGTNAVGAI